MMNEDQRLILRVGTEYAQLDSNNINKIQNWLVQGINVRGNNILISGKKAVGEHLIARSTDETVKTFTKKAATELSIFFSNAVLADNGGAPALHHCCSP